ncbi:MAG: discoidin domain-containing protein, partial [Myxococcales bacterium]|nr:discoidin domain-containing protein [Myxococcales bacterium]
VYNSFAPRTGRYWRIQSRNAGVSGAPLYPSLRMELYRSDSDVFTGHDSTVGVYSGLQCATGNAPGVGNVRDSYACPDCYCGAIQFNAARGELFTLVAGRDEATSTPTQAPMSVVPVGFSSVCGDGVVDYPQAFGVANGRIANSQLTANLQNDAGPETARLNSNLNENTSGAGWHLDPSRSPGVGQHFIQTDFLVPMEVGAIATQGRRHNTWSDWVTSYRVEYRTTASGAWTAVTNPATGTTTFTGNYDKDSIVINRWTPVTARYWRVVPLTTNNWIGLRLEWFPEYEECDDGNATNGDGCSSTCGLERTPTACMIDSSVQGAESTNESLFYGRLAQDRGTPVSDNCPPGTYAAGFRATWVSPVVQRFGGFCAPLVASATGAPRTITRGTVAVSSSAVRGNTSAATGILTDYQCPAGQFMMGVSIAYGDAIDRLQAICGTWAYNASSTALTRTRNTSAVFGPGTGGPNPTEYLCPADQIVTGFDLLHTNNTTGVAGFFIHNIRVKCGPALPTSPLFGVADVNHLYFDAACRGGTSLSTSHVAVGLNSTVSGSNANRIQPTCGTVANAHNTTTNPYSYRLTRGRASTAAGQGASVVTGTAVGAGTLATAGTCPAGTFMTGVSYVGTANTNLRPRCRSFTHDGTSLVAGTVSNATTSLGQTYDCPGNGIVTRIIARSSGSASAPSQVAVECGQVNAFCDTDSYVTIMDVSGQSLVVAPNSILSVSAPVTNCREVADVEIDAEWSSLTASGVLYAWLDNSSSGGFWDFSKNATFVNPVGWSRNYAYEDFYDLDLWDWARGTWTLYFQNTSTSTNAGTLRDLRVRIRCLNP